MLRTIFKSRSDTDQLDYGFWNFNPTKLFEDRSRASNLCGWTSFQGYERALLWTALAPRHEALPDCDAVPVCPTQPRQGGWSHRWT
eukprot:UN13559